MRGPALRRRAPHASAPPSVEAQPHDEPAVILDGDRAEPEVLVERDRSSVRARDSEVHAGDTAFAQPISEPLDESAPQPQPLRAATD